MTIPKFRELLANFQAQAEAYLDQGGPFATADTGFMKRRDHLAELQKVRDEAAAVVQKYRDEASDQRERTQAMALRAGTLSQNLERARSQIRKLASKLGHANQRAVRAEARLLEYGIELKPAKLPAKFRKKAETWIDRLRARASQPEQ